MWCGVWNSGSLNLGSSLVWLPSTRPVSVCNIYVQENVRKVPSGHLSLIRVVLSRFWEDFFCRNETNIRVSRALLLPCLTCTFIVYALFVCRDSKEAMQNKWIEKCKKIILIVMEWEVEFFKVIFWKANLFNVIGREKQYTGKWF